MKPYKRRDFLELPKGTLFSRFESSQVQGLYVKQSYKDDWESSFIEQDLFEPLIEDKDSVNGYVEWIKNVEDLIPFELDYDCCQRDSTYDEEEVFVVWEDEDINKLVAMLNFIRTKMQ